MVELYSVKQGKIVEFELSVDHNGEIIATNGDEFLKFPVGLDKTELKKLFKKHNDENEGKIALTEEEQEAGSKEAAASQKLIDSL